MPLTVPHHLRPNGATFFRAVWTMSRSYASTALAPAWLATCLAILTCPVLLVVLAGYGAAGLLATDTAGTALVCLQADDKEARRRKATATLVGGLLLLALVCGVPCAWAMW